ncbi:MAG: MFS transporter [Rhizobiales bacterium]|nr:MFS transporter [Hyphomicrobiales bacterium]
MPTTSREPSAAVAPAPKMTPALTLLFAVACGAIAANLYYAQPLVALIAPDVGMPPKVASLVVTLTQIGYGLGLIFLVPIGDIFENRRLILTSVVITSGALVLTAFAPSALPFLAAALFFGFTSSAVQMLVPLAASMADEETRGRTVGNVMSGLTVGVLLARPLAGFIADLVGWRGVFGVSALLMIALSLLLARHLPRRQPTAQHSYGELIRSLWTLFKSTPALRRRGFYQFALFADFALFWTAVPLELAGGDFRLSQTQIAIFALAGASGALAAPIGGHLADRGHSRIATGLCLAGGSMAFLLAGFGRDIRSIILMALAAIALDFVAQMNTVIGQREIYLLPSAARNRLNGLYIAMFFLGGATGSAMSSPLYETGGWRAVVIAGAILPAIAFLYYLTELRTKRA